jgi:hypothetical protein
VTCLPLQQTNGDQPPRQSKGGIQSKTADLFTDEPESQIFPDQLVGLGLKGVKWLPRRAVLGIGVLGDGEGGNMRKPLDRIYSLSG